MSKGHFELTVKVHIREGHPLIRGPEAFENGSRAQDELGRLLAEQMTFGVEHGHVQYLDPQIVWVRSKRILGNEEMKDLALLLFGGAAPLAPDVDEMNTLDRLAQWHPQVHVSERSEDGVITLHR